MHALLEEFLDKWVWPTMPGAPGAAFRLRITRDKYCAVAPDRLIGMGVIPISNVDDAIAEMKHCKKLGLKGVLLGGLPGGKGYPTPEDDRFWAAALALDMPVTVHVQLYRTGARANQPPMKYPNENPEMMA